MNPGRPRTRVATYRFQLTPESGFRYTADLFDHVAALGVSHVYLSPIAEAVPGSAHGYDVVDHARARAELGGAHDLELLLDRADQLGLGVIIDHVPNHTSVARPELNERWWSVLRHGPTSPAERWFDIDWDATGGKVIVPRLGEPLERVLAAGGLEIVSGPRHAELHYGDLRLPLAAGTHDLPLADALRQQHYELVWWRDERRNVRRFFTIDDLVAVRAEVPSVAATIDALPVALCDHPAFAGVRVDHVDGLRDPGEYLRGLRDRLGDERWLLVEKILAPGETLPASWPVDGTTGYEHITYTEHAFLDPDAERPLLALWHEATGDARSFSRYEDEARREVLAGGLRPDLDRLVRALLRWDSALSPDATRQAVVEVTIGLHRYRTYRFDEPSERALDDARERAAAARPELTDEIDTFVRALRSDDEVAARWRQLTGPVMAKGAEDRAFYRYLPLPSLCEVGGDPGRFADPHAAFHAHQASVLRTMPETLNAGTTHDTKRSEGVRARSLALAADAERWADVVRRWIGRPDRPAASLDPATAMLALHTVVTAWPIDEERLTEYLVKSAREADLHTSWFDPDPDHEDALAQIAQALVAEVGEGASALARFAAAIDRPGLAASLAALLVRLTAPGVPDLYQGTTAFTYSLVDPDNRVEPDWDERRDLLARARQLDAPTTWSGDDVDANKAVVIVRALELRRRRAAAFGPTAGYAPLEFSGADGDRVLGFLRSDADGPAVAVICSTAFDHVGGGSLDVSAVLPPGAWRDVLADEGALIEGDATVQLGGALGRFPALLLERVRG